MSSIKTRSRLETGVDLEAISAWARRYEAIVLDLGAGDGRFARALVESRPEAGVIAVDTCGENAVRELRRAPENLRFIVADALTLPDELHALASETTINFPWGSLLRAMLAGDERLYRVLGRQALTIRVNAGAIAEAGYDFDAGSAALLRAVRRATPATLRTRRLDRADLKQIPSTWAKRLAFGRDPRAIEIKTGR